MKFISSVVAVMIICVILFISLGLIFKCDHTRVIEVFTFQPENSRALSYSKSYCDECRKCLHTALFQGSPTNESYIDAVEEHCGDKSFVKGEYDIVKAEVLSKNYNSSQAKIRCTIKHGDVQANFSVVFKGEYKEAVSLLETGDEITFYGKSALTGLSWTDCELITE